MTIFSPDIRPSARQAVFPREPAKSSEIIIIIIDSRVHRSPSSVDCRTLLAANESPPKKSLLFRRLLLSPSTNVRPSPGAAVGTIYFFFSNRILRRRVTFQTGFVAKPRGKRVRFTRASVIGGVVVKIRPRSGYHRDIIAVRYIDFQTVHRHS